jgi:hypothetical protein
MWEILQIQAVTDENMAYVLYIRAIHSRCVINNHKYNNMSSLYIVHKQSYIYIYIYIYIVEHLTQKPEDGHMDWPKHVA